jgi:hypothetical protein
MWNTGFKYFKLPCKFVLLLRLIERLCLLLSKFVLLGQKYSRMILSNSKRPILIQIRIRNPGSNTTNRVFQDLGIARCRHCSFMIKIMEEGCRNMDCPQFRLSSSSIENSVFRIRRIHKLRYWASRGSGSSHHHAKIVRNPLISTVL